MSAGETATGAIGFQADQEVILDRFLREEHAVVADLGAGLGRHADHMLQRGREVVAIDCVVTEELQRLAARRPGHCRILIADITHLPMPDGALDAVWASHCLEHTLDPLAVLAEWRRVLRPDGRLGVIVPPFKSQVVGRHVFTGWSVGQLMLTLFRVGFDVRNGSFAKMGYNVCAIVQPSADPPALRPNDEILCRYADRFPPQIEAQILRSRQANAFGETIGCFEGEIDRLGW